MKQSRAVTAILVAVAVATAFAVPSLAAAAPSPQAHSANAHRNAERQQAATTHAPIRPVLIVPGDGSNQLEARLTGKPHVPHFYCDKRTTCWYRLWLSVTQLLPGAVDCWADNMRLVVNATTGRASAPPGVETRVPYWGTTTGFEELDPSVPGHATAVFRDLVAALLGDASLGPLERNATLAGAPYDFRYTPDSPQGLSGVRLAALVERTSARAGGARVTLVSHSMGGLQVKYFLSRRSAAWKAKYIRRWVAISTPWTGASQEPRLFASGNPEGLPVQASSVRDEQRSYETNAWLLPRAGVYDPHTVLVRTPSRNYTATDADYAAFFAAIGYPVGDRVRRRVHALVDPLAAPGVEVHCMFSRGVATPRTYTYASDTDFSGTPAVAHTDGDGTVTHGSLAVCGRWAATGAQGAAPVTVATYANVTHSGMLKSPAVLRDLVALLKED